MKADDKKKGADQPEKLRYKNIGPAKLILPGVGEVESGEVIESDTPLEHVYLTLLSEDKSK